MSTITTKDDVEIFYKDWGTGQPIVFSHGWPLSADDWDNQMLFFVGKGYRVIAHDRRGHGRSTQTSDGHDMDHYAADLAALTEYLDLKDAIHVGHSTGGGEVTHYLGQHGESRVAKAVLISAVPPLMVKTPANPNGVPKTVFDDLQAQLAANRSNFYRALPGLICAVSHANAEIVCEGNFQIVDGMNVSTPYCQDENLAVDQRKLGVKVTGGEVRHHPELKREACASMGNENETACAADIAD